MEALGRIGVFRGAENSLRGSGSSGALGSGGASVDKRGGGGGWGGGLGLRLILLRVVLRAKFARQVCRCFFMWKRFLDYDKTEQQLVTARNLVDAATQAQVFVSELVEKNGSLVRQSLAREVEIGKRDGTIEKLEKEKKDIQEELKQAKNYGIDIKRRAAVLGFQVKRFIEIEKNRAAQVK